MKLKVGERLRSPVSDVELIVTIGQDVEVALDCAGVPMARAAEIEAQSPVPAGHGETSAVLLGKRYRLPGDDSFELLVVKGGDGPLSVDGRQLEPAKAKELPSSD